jgi:hypothetical protein
MKKLRLLAYVLKYFGIGWVAYRIRYALARRLGLLARHERFLDEARTRATAVLAAAGFSTVESYALYRRRKAPAFFFTPENRASFRSMLHAWDQGRAPSATAFERIRAGTFAWFGHTEVAVGCPPDWHRNPFTGVRAPSNVHWSRVDEASLGDIKAIWELSRFASVYPLVRHYWRSGDPEAAELFWRLVEDWDAANPACQGVNWRCSQEISIRVMAWCVGLYGFLDAEATTSDRIARLARMIWASGCRIALDLPDAISQQNNHGMSAAVGLLTIGLLFPEFPESAGWVAEGRHVLERLGRELIYDDGAFAQHSLNYQRLMLQLYVWAMRLGQLSGVPFSGELQARVRRSAEMMWQLQDDRTGSVPQYGQFDGALILPLDNCDHLDFRPVTQAAGFLADRRRWWPEGPWDEGLLWLFGPSALSAPEQAPERKDLAAPEGGYYTLRGADTFVLTRCATFRHRPGQPDMLHADVWWRGHNVATDAGTFSYGNAGPESQELVRTPAHNTVSVDGADQMERFGRFLWFPWLSSRVLRQTSGASGDVNEWEGEHDGYARLGVRHRRRIVRLPSSAWLVIDRLDAPSPHTYRLHWLLPDLAYQWDSDRLAVTLPFPEGEYAIQVVSLGGPAAGDIRRAAADGEGWRSRYYHSREPALSLSVTAYSSTQVFATLLAPAPASVRIAHREIEVTRGEGAARQVVLCG